MEGKLQSVKPAIAVGSSNLYLWLARGRSSRGATLVDTFVGQSRPMAMNYAVSDRESDYAVQERARQQAVASNVPLGLKVNNPDGLYFINSRAHRMMQNTMDTTTQEMRCESESASQI